MINNKLEAVDRTVNALIGESYPIVKEVYDHLDEIGNLQDASDNLNYITEELPKIEEVHSNLNSINTVHQHISVIDNVSQNLQSIKDSKVHAEAAKQSAIEAKQSEETCEEATRLVTTYVYDVPHLVDSLDEVEDYPYDGFFAVGGYGDPGHHGQDISNRLVKAKGSTELRTLGERFADVVNVKDFGAKGDGVTDDTKAFEAATLAVAKRGLVLVPSGNYKLNKTIVGMFLSVGNVRTTEPIDFIDLNFFKTRQFKDRLSLGMAFTYPVPWESQDSRFYLQGFCSDNDDFVFFGMRTQSHSAQKIVRYSMSTGEVLVKDFTALWHVNAMTYCDGKVYVTPMNASLPNVVVLNAATLERERDIVLTDVPAAGGALAYDSYTDRFYYYANAAVWVFDTTWRLQKKSLGSIQIGHRLLVRLTVRIKDFCFSHDLRIQRSPPLGTRLF